MQSQTERIVGTIIAIVLILFASIAAPKLPKSITKYLENPQIRLLFFVLIGYLATKDLVIAIIASITVLISYQTLMTHNIIDKIMKKTKDVINEQTLKLISVSNENIKTDQTVNNIMNENESIKSVDINELPKSEKKVSFSDTVNVMEIDTNVVTETPMKNVTVTKNKKYLQGSDNVDERLLNNDELLNYNLSDESCLNNYVNKFSCASLLETNNELSGYTSDFESNEMV